ncbi:4Fe-4S dicluster domain-containing protein [Parvibacter caecicola]|uniref:4Fe-4S dicluster domain-containing protein n=1 Tax=Parvibacter caecicola TaxID=747645 RepID=A0A3N0A7L5_9ACTN|nr:4Fe-4S dicluster domain-containing protein [Parvibacter caecicola]MBB3171408.1 molybdopterin-containing oxidoreductase family iron-sulfur binding subunit [Parvibacter caecicola]MCR2042230.1 4Fe-4S dicluster domain-containing protein [Parvibacter caecicola]RNL09076.1 4Fe-4S ferredoxin [Parvibacter caecicola]TJW10866.1 4Fe-4S dicluster domain-containing protein [Parvibacter caecicola]
MARYGMAIDTKRCVGCNACTIACKSTNNIPEGIFWTRVLTDGGDVPDVPRETEMGLFMNYLPMGCQHCENPACVKVCPVGATYKDPETGVVRQDYGKCIGCRMCMAACPYTGVRSFTWEEPSYAIGFATGDIEVPKHEKHVVEKCTFCYQRITKGEDPACMELCPPRARFWGDLDDPHSDVSKLIASRSCKQLLVEEGTKPSVYYLV